MTEVPKDPAGRSGHILTGSYLLVRALALVTYAVVARLVGTADYGAAGAGIAIGSLVAAPLSAVQWAVTRQVSTAPPGHYVLRRLSLTMFAAAALVVLIGAAASGLADQALHLHGVGPSTFIALYVGAVFLEGVPAGVLLATGRFRYVAGCVLLGAIVRILISVIWGALHPNVVGLLVGTAVGEMVTAVSLTVPLMSELTRRQGTEHIDFGEVWLSIRGYTGVLAIMSIDTVAARHWLSGPDSGLYASASTIASGAYFVSVSAIAARYPAVSRGAASGSSRAFWKGLAEVSGLALLASGALALGAGPIVRIAFGKSYAGAAEPLVVLGISYALLGVLSFLVNHLLAHRSRAILLPWGGTAILAALVLVRHGSTIAVASDALIASAASFVTILVLSVRLERGSKPASG